MKKIGFLAAAAVCAGFGLAVPGHAQDKSIIVQSTTSTQNSGLFDHILPVYEKASGVKVNVVAVGTGQAIKNARNCDGDVLFVHAKPAEEMFVSDGYGVKRFDVMYNDFVIVGPPTDPAKVAGRKDAAGSLKAIADAKAVFASRGDDSGTHKKELSLWQDAGVDVQAASGTWYRETGSGMGATLNASVGMGAYAMTDRATWIAFKNKAEFKIAVEGDKAMFNQYGIIQVNPEKCPNVKADAANSFINWIITKDGQSAIAAYKLDGKQLFFANAAKEGAS
ncbi:MAG: solute-binding protein [Anderseniella sp.]|nr:solute-binding protein [Anderseniella sp.]